MYASVKVKFDIIWKVGFFTMSYYFIKYITYSRIKSQFVSYDSVWLNKIK